MSYREARCAYCDDTTTEIEKLMVDLKTTPSQAGGISAFRRFIHLLLPEEVLALLDCYLAAVRLTEYDSPLVSAAAVTIGEIAARTAEELTAA